MIIVVATHIQTPFVSETSLCEVHSILDSLKHINGNAKTKYDKIFFIFTGN